MKQRLIIALSAFALASCATNPNSGRAVGTQPVYVPQTQMPPIQYNHQMTWPQMTTPRTTTCSPGYTPGSFSCTGY